MFDAIFWFVVGALVGWNLPQPVWAKDLVEKVKSVLVK